MSAGPSGTRHYGVRKPVAAFFAGAAVALLAGLIGLGGAEFRLPLLIFVFALYAHRAVRINLLISLVTLAAAAAVRLQLIPEAGLGAHWTEMLCMSAGGVIAAWVGAGVLGRLPKDRLIPLIAALLAVIACVLLAEALLPSLAPAARMVDGWTVPAALLLGLVIGGISSLLGVAGGEFIIPAMVLVFGADLKTAGTASVLISLPIVFSGVLRHALAGKFRSTTMLGYLALPMSLGSVAGAIAGGYVSTGISQEALRAVLAAILLVSAWKLWSKRDGQPAH